MATSESKTDGSDLAFKYVQEPSGHNTTLESLTKEVKHVLDADELKQTDFQEISTSEDSESDTSTSENVKLIRSASLGKIDDLEADLDETKFGFLSSLFKSAASCAERDLARIKRKLSDLQSLRTRPVAKLFETTNFLQTLLDELGAGERGKELLEKMEALRIDFNQLIATTIDTNYDVEVAHQRMFDLCEQLQHSLHCAQPQHSMNYPYGVRAVSSCANQRYAKNDTEKLQTRTAELEESKKKAMTISQHHEACIQFDGQRENEVTKINKAEKLSEQQQTQITGLKESSTALVDELDKLKESMKETENEMISATKNIETQLLYKNEQCELQERIQQLQQISQAKDASTAEKETKMQLKIDELTEGCREPEMPIAEITRARESKDEVAKLKDEVRKLTNFTRHMCLLIAQYVDDDTPGFDFPFETIDLDHLYKTYDRIVNGFYMELCQLRVRVEDLDKSCMAYMLCEEAKQDESSETGDDEALETSSSSGMESTTVDIQILFDNANEIVQKLKAISVEPQESEVMEILLKMRSLRSQIKSLRSYSEQFEKIKENAALLSMEENQSEEHSGAEENA